MERVYNSVQQIIDTCDEMIKFGLDSECVDVHSLSVTLKERCSELKKMFEENPSDTRNINIQKRIVEDTAIRLEFFLRVRMGLYEERNKMRGFAEKLYEDTKQKTIELSKRKEISPVVLNEWGVRTGWALKYLSRSRHILFDTTNEDEIQIRSISIALKRLEEENNER